MRKLKLVNVLALNLCILMCICKYTCIKAGFPIKNSIFLIFIYSVKVMDSNFQVSCNNYALIHANGLWNALLHFTLLIIL